MIEPSARATDGKSLLVEQFTDASDEKHFVVLVVAAIAAPLDRFELGKFLFPVTQNVRLDATKVADFTNGEVAFRGNWRQLGLTFAAVALAVAAVRCLR